MTLLAETGLKPASREAMDLLMAGTRAFARMEQVGIRIDTDYLDRAIRQVQKSIADLKKEFVRCPEYEVWRRHYGDKMSFNNSAQLGRVIFDLCGHPRNPHKKNKQGKDKNDIYAFEHITLPFLNYYFTIKRLTNALGAEKKGLLGIKRETVDGRLHPFFDLYTAESYRSSSSRPNVHNIQVRDKAVSKIVRTAIVPSEGNVFLEGDFNIQEVRVSACYHNDPKLVEYILSGHDMHRDWALKLYKLTDELMGASGQEPGKSIRYNAKNKFTFPQFYGSTYINCAPALWEAISLMKLQTTAGVPLREHLESCGINQLGACSYEFEPEADSFELVVKETEDYMWKEIFVVYDQWKRDWWQMYQRQGGINTLTGFCMAGHFRRNQILCDPIQGSAFHCLLWTLIQVDRELRRRKMKARIVNQIHDSMLIDCPRSEVPEIIELLLDYGVTRIRDHYRWLSVPLKMEFELAEDCWANKKGLEV